MLTGGRGLHVRATTVIRCDLKTSNAISLSKVNPFILNAGLYLLFDIGIIVFFNYAKM